MEREKLTRLLDAVAEGNEEARLDLLAYIARQPAGIQALAYEALKEGGEDTYEQLILTLADDPSLYIQSKKPAKVRPTPSLALPDTSEVPVPMPSGRHLDVPTPLITTLRSGNRITRAAAARTMAEYGANAVPYLVEALKSDERLIMGGAAEALQTIGGAAVPAVLPLVGDQDEQRRWHAYKVLSTTADASAVPAMLSGLESSNSGIRWLAAEGLAHVGRSAVTPLLQRLTGEKLSTWLRNGAVHVLNKTKWANDQDRIYYTTLAQEIKNAPTATISHIARRELERTA